METFNHSSLIEFLEKENVNLSKVDKFEIRKGRFIARQGEEIIYNIELNQLKKHVRFCCKQCDDFSSEFADLSIGNIGSPDGWSTVIVRTEEGEKALQKAKDIGYLEIKPIEDKTSINAIIKIAKLKKNRSV